MSASSCQLVTEEVDPPVHESAADQQSLELQEDVQRNLDIILRRKSDGATPELTARDHEVAGQIIAWLISDECETPEAESLRQRVLDKTCTQECG
ncbi:hypothetical protein [Thioalkalivibrio sp. AL21]|uniref:hypothetical protein n=1 Tax=Thioalkalivibrio sp. AL21 TaxID=1158152 RepID=UPI000364080C|nr:hypothetical protein [Thioalkalivibrio sp. AL21]